MTAQDMHTAVKLLLDKADTLNYPNYRAEEIDFFLNYAQDRFVKHRYDGANARNRGLEETQKRTDDLRNITASANLSPEDAAVTNYPNGRFVNLPLTSPNKYWFSITEQVEIIYPACDPKRRLVASGEIKNGQVYIVTSGSVSYAGGIQDATSEPQTFTGTQQVFGGNGEYQTVTTYTGDGTVYEAIQERVNVKPIQHDDYNKLVNDPFNKPNLNTGYKEVHRLELGGQFEILFPDNDYIFNSLIIRYVREPQRILLSSLTLPGTDCELADHTHQEIVDMAVSSMLENIESQRYQSNSNELNKLE
jgi:hypothetical protein